MKTLGRILLILTTFTLIMGITYVAVNAMSTGTSFSPGNGPAFNRQGEGFQRPPGERPEPRGEGPRGGRWMLGLIKNLGIVAFIVVLIALPKSITRKRSSSVMLNKG